MNTQPRRASAGPADGGRTAANPRPSGERRVAARGRVRQNWQRWRSRRQAPAARCSAREPPSGPPRCWRHGWPGQAFFLDPEQNPQLPVLGRMWGIRNLALAAGMYGASGPSRARWWRLQVAVDALDFAVIVAEWRRGAVPGPAAGLMAGTALLATGSGRCPPEPRLHSPLRREQGAGSDLARPRRLGRTRDDEAVPRSSSPAGDWRRIRCGSHGGRRRGRCGRFDEQIGEQLERSVIGGHSFGGRVASLVAAETAPAGLVLLSYPLHRPGHPEELRVEHWPEDRLPGAPAVGRPRPVRARGASARGGGDAPKRRAAYLPGPTSRPHVGRGRCRGADRRVRRRR